MDQFTHMQHDEVRSSRQKAAATKIAVEAIFVVCRCDSIGQFTHRRHDTTACDTTRFFAPHTIKWISSHICSTTLSGRHDKELQQQKSLLKRFLSCVAETVSRKLIKKTVFIGISPGFINL